MVQRRHMLGENSSTHQPADLLLPVGCRSSRGFDHSGRLIIRQLLDTTLTSYNITHLRGKQENEKVQQK